MKFIVTAIKALEFPDSIERLESHVVVNESVTMKQIHDRLKPFESLRIVIPVGELEGVPLCKQ